MSGSGRLPNLSTNDQFIRPYLGRKYNHWSSEQVEKVTHKKDSFFVSK